jgi:TetR/AcrR family fatty acid metabolism transcriptional regulator
VTEYLDIIRSVITEGQQQGVFRQGIDPTVASKVFFGALDEMVTNWVLSRRAYKLPTTARAVIDILFYGLSATALDRR